MLRFRLKVHTFLTFFLPSAALIVLVRIRDHLPESIKREEGKIALSSLQPQTFQALQNMSLWRDDFLTVFRIRIRIIWPDPGPHRGSRTLKTNNFNFLEH